MRWLDCGGEERAGKGRGSLLEGEGDRDGEFEVSDCAGMEMENERAGGQTSIAVVVEALTAGVSTRLLRSRELISDVREGESIGVVKRKWKEVHVKRMMSFGVEFGGFEDRGRYGM